MTRLHSLPFALLLALSFTPVSGQAAVPVIRAVNDGHPSTLVVEGRTLKKKSAITEIRFDAVSMNSDKKSAELAFSVPAGAISFAIHISPVGRQDFTYVHTLTNPQGVEIISERPRGVSETVLTNPAVTRGQRVSQNAVHLEVFKQLSSTPVPVQPGVVVRPGKWRITVAAENHAVPVNVVILVKTLAGPLDGKTLGSLRLNVSATAASGFPSEIASLKESLASTMGFYRSIGVLLSIVTAKPLAEEYDATSDAEQLRPEYFARLVKMLKLNSSPARLPAVDVYLVKRNNFANGGIANLNAASSIFSSKKEKLGGVVVWTESHLDANVTLAHELGHHLGLYHTNYDQYSDTRAGDHWLEGDQGHRENLMQVGGGDFILSKQQKDTIRKHVAIALYRE